MEYITLASKHHSGVHIGTGLVNANVRKPDGVWTTRRKRQMPTCGSDGVDLAFQVELEGGV